MSQYIIVLLMQGEQGSSGPKGDKVTFGNILLYIKMACDACSHG